uniref:ATPase AAA-type core domain-containing protein n=1 Tax=Brassica oleracea var. oleracea TaxID=109376 RepID=A0A0D3AQ20_BRAOL
MTFSQIPHSLMCKRLYYPHLISTQLLLSLPVEIHISLIRRNPSPLSNKIRRLSQAAGDRRISENRYSKAPKFSRWRCSRRQRDEFFSLMCHNVSLERSSANARVMVLAATNRPSELDEAIMRRLPQAFEIGMPERKERAEILKVTLKGERVPRPLSQLDLEKVLATSKKTQAAAGEYCGLRWSREPVEVEAAISGISKLLVSQFINLQSGSQDKTIHCASIFVVSREIVALHIRVLELLEDGDIRSIKPFEILKLLNLNSDSSEVVHVHSKP